MFIADLDNNCIRKVTPPVYNITGASVLCAGATMSLSDATTGGTWSSSSTGIATVGSVTGIITGVSAGVDTITYTVGLNNVTKTIIVNPLPALTSTLTPLAICDTTKFNYTPTCAIPGTTFSWSRAAVTGISNSAATGTGNPNELLVNTTKSPVVVTYVYTLSASGCTNTQTVTLTEKRCSPTLVNEVTNSMEGIKVYPNPTHGSFTIEMPWAKNKIRITVSDIIGKVIETRDIDAQTGIREVFELNKQPQGTYLIKVDAGFNTYREKVVIW